MMNKTAKAFALSAILILNHEVAFAESKALLDALLQNGAITQVQYDKLIEQKTAGISESQTQGLLEILRHNQSINQGQYDHLVKKQEAKVADDINVSVNEKGLQVATADKQFKFKFGGRMQVEANGDIGDNQLSQGATEGVEFRRARMYMQGVVWGDYKYMVEVDFADNGVAVKDAYLTYAGLDWFDITVGHQKQPISMELQESSNDIMFAERSTVNVLTAPAFDRAIGIHFKSSSNDWSAQLGFYGDSLAPEKNGNVDEGWSVASRLTYAPINVKAQVVHLGAFGGYKGLSGSNSTVKFFSETSHMSNLKLTNVAIDRVSGIGILGAELAYMQGAFSIQGEYAHEWIARHSGEKDLDLNAVYVQMAWTLTGESRQYKGSDGEFKYLKPSQNFSWQNNTWGAFEVAARYGLSDIAYGGYIGGTREQDITAALNWYLNNNVRIIADYRYAFDLAGSRITELDGSDLDHGVHTFTVRTQFKI